MADRDFDQALAAATARSLDDLVELVSLPSVSSQPTHDADLEACAARICELLTEIGCPDVRTVREGGKPAIIGRFPAPDGAPTVCLYAHYDVQPTGEVAEWSSDPFVAQNRDGRLYGRGTADDKGGVAMHLGVLRAFDGKPPIGVTCFFEGEEEIGSPSLAGIIAAHHDLLASDLFVIADSGNWEVGTPGVTTSLRGIAEAYVQVDTLASAVHSGEFGGAVPDSLTALCKLLGTLVDDSGSCAIAGLGAAPDPDVDYSEQRLRAESGLLDDVALVGEGPIAARLWSRPSVSVLAIDARPIADASNVLHPSARAKVSVRVAPGDDAVSAQAALIDHLTRHAPYGTRVTVTGGEAGQPGIIAFDGPIADAARVAFEDAFGVAPAQIGQGGSIPMVADFQHAFPQAAVLVTAVADPHCHMHGIDESLHLGDFAKALRAEAMLMAALGN